MKARNKIPGFLNDQERVALFGPGAGLEKRAVSFRLTNDAIEILTSEAKKLGIDKTRALEVLLREIREIRRRNAR